MATGLPSKLLTPAIADFVGNWLSIYRKEDQYTVEQLATAIRVHSKLSQAVELRALFALSMMRDYEHEDEKIQESVRANFSQLPGSWSELLLKLQQYLPYGFLAAEKTYKVRGGVAQLVRLNVLNQGLCSFEGTVGKIKHIRYNSPMEDIVLPYENLFHICNQDYLQINNSPYGIALASRAMPYIDLHQIIMVALAVAVNRQATPVLVGKTDIGKDSSLPLYTNDGTTPLLGLDGRPLTIRKEAKFLKDLKEVENGSVLVIDRMDELIAIAQQTDGQFFRSVLYYIDAVILWSFLISPVIAGTSESGVGDSSLIEGHLSALKIVARTQMKIFSDQLVEQVLKPMLTYNFGELDNYGEFPVPEEDSTDTVALLNAIGSTVQRGGLSAEDEAVVTRIKELAGIEASKPTPPSK